MTWDLTNYERMDDMGYRSDVHALFYTTHKEDLPVLKLYMDENFPKDETFFDLKEIDSKVIHGYELVFENVKWYDDYDDIKVFDAFKTKYQALIEEQETGKEWCFEFVRVGEDDDDIEREQYDSSYVLSVSRKIECDY
jgi:hypothetical protein